MNHNTQDIKTPDKLPRKTFGYFLHETNPSDGLVIGKKAPGNKSWSNINWIYDHCKLYY